MANEAIEHIVNSQEVCSRLIEGASPQETHYVMCQMSGALRYIIRAAKPKEPADVRSQQPLLDDDKVEIEVAISQQETCYVWLQITSMQLLEHGSTLQNTCRIAEPTKYEPPAKYSLRNIDCHVSRGTWRCCSALAKEVFEKQVDARQNFP